MVERVNRVGDVWCKMKAVIEFLTREGRTPKEIFTLQEHLW